MEQTAVETTADHRDTHAYSIEELTECRVSSADTVSLEVKPDVVLYECVVRLCGRDTL